MRVSRLLLFGSPVQTKIAVRKSVVESFAILERYDAKNAAFQFGHGSPLPNASVTLRLASQRIFHNSLAPFELEDTVVCVRPALGNNESSSLYERYVPVAQGQFCDRVRSPRLSVHPTSCAHSTGSRCAVKCRRNGAS